MTSSTPITRLRARLPLVLALAVLAAACPRTPPDDEPGGPRKVARGGADEAIPVPGACELGFVRMGIVPQGGAGDVPAQFAPLETWLGSQLGARVELTAYSDYDQLISDVVSGELDVAQLPPLAFVLARERDPALLLLATQIASGGVHYASYLMVRRDSEVQRVRDLEHKRLAFVSPSSASGFVYPVARLLQDDVDVRAVMKHAVFTGSHYASVKAVLEGTLDAAATYSGGLALSRDTGLDTRDLRVLGITAAIPQEALVAHSHLPTQHVRCLQRAFLLTNKSSAPGRAALARFAAQDGWTVTSEAFYDQAREQLQAVRSALPEVAP